MDPEWNIKLALDNFNFDRERKRIFTRIVREHYIVPNGIHFSSKAGELVMDAYTKNNLELVGLPYTKEPNELHLHERDLLLDLGYKVLETSIVSEYDLKSYW